MLIIYENMCNRYIQFGRDFNNVHRTDNIRVKQDREGHTQIIVFIDTNHKEGVRG